MLALLAEGIARTSVVVQSAPRALLAEHAGVLDIPVRLGEMERRLETETDLGARPLLDASFAWSGPRVRARNSLATINAACGSDPKLRKLIAPVSADTKLRAHLLPQLGLASDRGFDVLGEWVGNREWRTAIQSCLERARGVDGELLMPSLRPTRWFRPGDDESDVRLEGLALYVLLLLMGPAKARIGRTSLEPAFDRLARELTEHVRPGLAVNAAARTWVHTAIWLNRKQPLTILPASLDDLLADPARVLGALPAGRAVVCSLALFDPLRQAAHAHRLADELSANGKCRVVLSGCGELAAGNRRDESSRQAWADIFERADRRLLVALSKHILGMERMLGAPFALRPTPPPTRISAAPLHAFALAYPGAKLPVRPTNCPSDGGIEFAVDAETQRAFAHGGLLTLARGKSYDPWIVATPPSPRTGNARVEARFARSTHGFLDLSRCGIRSLDELPDLPLGLERIDLRENALTSLDGFPVLRKLHTLDISFNAIDDLRPIAGLPALGALRFRANQVRSLDPLRGLTELRTVDASHNRIEGDLEALGGLAQLRQLLASRNQIDSVASLGSGGHCKITTLDLAENTLRNLDGVQQLRCLEELNIRANRVQSLAPLAGLSALQRIHAAGNPLRDVDAIATLPKLETLIVEDARREAIPRDLRLRWGGRIDIPGDRLADSSLLDEDWLVAGGGPLGFGIFEHGRDGKERPVVDIEALDRDADGNTFCHLVVRDPRVDLRLAVSLFEWLVLDHLMGDHSPRGTFRYVDLEGRTTTRVWNG